MTRRDPAFDEWFDDAVGKDVAAALRQLAPRMLPSQALFELDPDAYKERRSNWLDDELAQAIASDLPEAVVKRNRHRLNDLSECVTRRCIVPFVGAGLSIPSGMPSWHGFLMELAGECRQTSAIRSYLKQGRFEEAATDLVGRLGENGFVERYRSAFRLRGTPQGAVKHLPTLAQRSVVTTNFDGVLEAAFEGTLDPVFLGRECSDFCRCVASGRTALLKLHGDIEKASSRVLTESEYNDAYGKRGEVDLKKPIAVGIRALFSTVTFLFIGCSLGADRTMELFASIADEHDRRTIPQHYAILSWRPGAERHERELNNRSIFPIWYSRDRHESVGVILKCLGQ